MTLMCYPQRFRDNQGQRLASSNKIVTLMLAIAKLFERALMTPHNWFPFPVQCFNIWNCFAQQNISLNFVTFVLCHSEVGFSGPAKLEVKICQGNELAMSLFQVFKFVIFSYLDWVSDEWLMVPISPVFLAPFLGDRVVRKFKFWRLT